MLLMLLIEQLLLDVPPPANTIPQPCKVWILSSFYKCWISFFLKSPAGKSPRHLAALTKRGVARLNCFFRNTCKNPGEQCRRLVLPLKEPRVVCLPACVCVCVCVSKVKNVLAKRRDNLPCVGLRSLTWPPSCQTHQIPKHTQTARARLPVHFVSLWFLSMDVSRSKRARNALRLERKFRCTSRSGVQFPQRQMNGCRCRTRLVKKCYDITDVMFT